MSLESFCRSETDTLDPAQVLVPQWKSAQAKQTLLPTALNLAASHGPSRPRLAAVLSPPFVAPPGPHCPGSRFSTWPRRCAAAHLPRLRMHSPWPGPQPEPPGPHLHPGPETSPALANPRPFSTPFPPLRASPFPVNSFSSLTCQLKPQLLRGAFLPICPPPGYSSGSTEPCSCFQCVPVLHRAQLATLRAAVTSMAMSGLERP